MDYKKLLNEKQYQAVTTTAQHARVIAGAGSGKTRVLTYRISYLINELGVDPWRILAITFTNKVAKEMKDRIIKLNPDITSKLYIQTYHSFCVRFLRSEIHNLGYVTNFTILDEEDKEKIIKDIAADNGKKRNDKIVKLTLGYIALKKCSGFYPEDIEIGFRKYEDEETCLSYYAEYEKRIRSMHMLDFDDLLLKTKYILESFPEVREKWQKRIEHILIDEFQDTNDIQFQIVKLLKSPTCSLFVVGDPDQTIYTWRGANNKIILDIDKLYDTKTIILNENYRSTKKILQVANTLIDKNKLRIKKDLFTENDDGDDVVTYNGFRSDEEANWVIGEILKLKNLDKDFTYRDVAILYRSSYLTLPFEKVLTQKRIPYVIYGGLRFYQRKEIKDVLAFFNLIVNSNDDVAFLRIINIPKRGIGEKTVDTIRKEASDNNCSIYKFIQEWKPDTSSVSLKTVMSLRSLINQIEDVKVQLIDKSEAYSSKLERFIREIHYYEYLASLDDESSEDRIKNVQSLFDDVQSYINDNPESTFEEYLQNVALLSAQDDITNSDSVSLMTIHTAKGLEFPYVFIIGFNDGVFPSERAILENPFEGLEEERRLCYVAFTRAMKKLYISANKEYSYTLQAQKIISRFFKEAGLSIHKPSSFTTFNDDDGFPKASLYAPIKSPIPSKPMNVPTAQSIDWKIGDILTHDVFGEGKVIGVDGNLIIVDFDNHGRKTMVGNHVKLHLVKKGGDFQA